MELKNERLFDVKERTARKWLLPVLGLVIVIGLPAVWFGPGVYSHWQQNRLIEKARQHLGNEDVAGAAICLRRVLALNGENLNASRSLAELAQKYVPSEEPALRERVCQIAPTSYPDAMAWALAALRLGRIAQAEEAFALMGKLGRTSGLHHEIGARVALAGGRMAEARAGFARALALEPANEENQFEVARIDIRTDDPAAQQRARETLDRLRANPKLRLAVLRTQIADLLNRTRISEAWALSRELVKDPAASFQDRLQYLDILQSQDHPGFAFSTAASGAVALQLGVLPESRGDTFTSYLSELQARARDDAASAAALISFLNSRGLVLLAVEWASSLSKELVSVPPVAPLLADAYRLALDWPRLEQFIAEANWGNVEFMRCAFAARVLREKGDRGASAIQWAEAVKLTEFRQERLGELAGIAASWGWAEEREELLWIGARNLKRPREALEALARIYQDKRKTQDLYNVWSRLLELEPADMTTKKNWVRLSLLLGKDRYQTGAVAQELHEQHPTDPQIACSYALVLHLRQQDKEALAVMNALKPEELRAPSVAGYYAIVLAANQRKEEAADFLALARQAPLLREEQELMDQTRRAIEVSMRRP